MKILWKKKFIASGQATVWVGWGPCRTMASVLGSLRPGRSSGYPFRRFLRGGDVWVWSCCRWGAEWLSISSGLGCDCRAATLPAVVAKWRSMVARLASSGWRGRLGCLRLAPRLLRWLRLLDLSAAVPSSVLTLGACTRQRWPVRRYPRMAAAVAHAHRYLFQHATYSST